MPDQVRHDGLAYPDFRYCRRPVMMPHRQAQWALSAAGSEFKVGQRVTSSGNRWKVRRAGAARASARAGLDDHGLRDAVARAEKGLIDADLGSGLIKQRVPRTGEGRSGGFRTVLIYRKGELAVFVHLFAKNRKANFDVAELEGLKAIAKVLMGLGESALKEVAIARGWREIETGNEE